MDTTTLPIAATKVLAVRKEFGEPFKDVVKGFAKLGYSRLATANTIGISYAWFDALCDRYDLKRHFRQRKDYLKICKPPGMKRKYSDEDLLAVLRKHPKSISMMKYKAVQGRPACKLYVRNFGSWNRAKELAHQ